MKPLKKTILSLLFSLLLWNSSTAQSAAPAEPSYLLIGAGVSGVIDDHKTIFGTVEWQPALRIGSLGTWIGFQGSDQNYYLAGGLLYNWHVTDRFFITPSFGAGIYANHDGTELGSAVEFRSGVDIGYNFKEAGRLSIGGWHISNAGLGNINPGTELIAVRYSIPLS